jgi:mRNA-degrading endonuclease HigB of HigAB toxin-antitoxin module
MNNKLDLEATCKMLVNARKGLDSAWEKYNNAMSMKQDASENYYGIEDELKSILSDGEGVVVDNYVVSNNMGKIIISRVYEGEDD